MDTEGTSWCPLAQALMHTGGNVLRQFLQLEIVTRLLTNYSRFWMTNVHNPTKINYLDILVNNLNGILNRSQNYSDKTLNTLLKSWTRICDNENAVMEQMDRLKQWKNDIEKECNKTVSSSVDDILKSWFSQIEQEIHKMMPLCKATSEWNNTFHVHLQDAQISLLLAIEKNDGYLSSFCQKLKSLSKPSSLEFEEHVRSFRKELGSWKTTYHTILHRFCNECRTSVSKWLLEAQHVPQSYAMVKFLKRFEHEIEDCDLQAQVDLFCDKWDDDLHEVFNRYEKQIKGDISTEAIVSLAEGLSKELENFSLKDKKIKDFFSSFNPPEFPRVVNIERSKLKSISRTSDLNSLDLTVLVAVWKKGNFVHSPLQDRDEYPYIWDTTIGADILRLRKQRNNIADHIEQVGMSSNTFEIMRKELTMLLGKIASRCGGKLNTDLSIKFDPQREYELKREFLTWCINDILVQLSEGSTEGRKCIDMLQSIQTTLEKLLSSRGAFTCRFCNKDFSTHYDLRKHMGIHIAFTCRSCNIDFSTDSDLVVHMATHQDYTCRCNEAFSRSHEIVKHMRTHQDFRCRSCYCYYSTREAIGEHIRTHWVRQCGRCERKFETRDQLADHERTHHTDENSCTFL